MFPVARVPTTSIISQIDKESKDWDLGFGFQDKFEPELLWKRLAEIPMKHKHGGRCFS